MSLTTMTRSRSLPAAMLFSASQAIPPVSAPSPTTATTCRSVSPAQLVGLGDAVRPGQRGRGVGVLDDVVRRLGPARVAGQPAALAQAGEVLPAGEQLVHVGLVAGVEDDRVARASRRPGARRWSARRRRGSGRGVRRCGRPARPGTAGSATARSSSSGTVSRRRSAGSCRASRDTIESSSSSTGGAVPASGAGASTLGAAPRARPDGARSSDHIRPRLTRSPHPVTRPSAG